LQGFLREGGGVGCGTPWTSSRCMGKNQTGFSRGRKGSKRIFCRSLGGRKRCALSFPRFGSVGVDVLGDPKSVAPRNASTPFSVRRTEQHYVKQALFPQVGWRKAVLLSHANGTPWTSSPTNTHDAWAKIKPFSHAAGRVPGESFALLFAGENAVLYLFLGSGS